MILDIVAVVIIMASALIAFLRGFIREMLTIIGVAGGFGASLLGGPFLSGLIHDWMKIDDENPGKIFDLIPEPIAATAMAYGSIFIVVVIALSIVSHYTSDFAKAAGLGPTDRTLGVMFGMARGILLLGVLFLPFHLLMENDTKKEWFGNSQSLFYIELVSGALGHFLPEDFDTRKEMEDKSEDTIEKIQTLGTLNNIVHDAKDGEKAKEQNKEQEGYDETERNNLDRLFKDKAGQ